MSLGQILAPLYAATDVTGCQLTAAEKYVVVSSLLLTLPVWGDDDHTPGARYRSSDCQLVIPRSAGTVAQQYFAAQRETLSSRIGLLVCRQGKPSRLSVGELLERLAASDTTTPALPADIEAAVQLETLGSEGVPMGRVLRPVHRRIVAALKQDAAVCAWFRAPQQEFLAAMVLAGVCEEAGLRPTGTYSTRRQQLMLPAEAAAAVSAAIADSPGAIGSAVDETLQRLAADRVTNGPAFLRWILEHRQGEKSPLPWPFSVLWPDSQ